MINFVKTTLNMKKLPFFMLMLASLNSFAQKATITYFDENGNVIDNGKNAANFKVITKENDSAYTVRYYKNFGPMIWQKTYKDADMKIANGLFIWYRKDGYADSVSKYSNNNIVYTNLSSPKKFNPNEKYFTLLSPAKFPGEQSAWVDYLRNSLNNKIARQIPKYKDISNNTAIVGICFLVNKQGFIDEGYVYQSCGFPFDIEALRVINESPKWQPAIISDNTTAAYRQKQRITFSLK